MPGADGPGAVVQHAVAVDAAQAVAEARAAIGPLADDFAGAVLPAGIAGDHRGDAFGNRHPRGELLPPQIAGHHLAARQLRRRPCLQIAAMHQRPQSAVSQAETLQRIQGERLGIRQFPFLHFEKHIEPLLHEIAGAVREELGELFGAVQGQGRIRPQGFGAEGRRGGEGCRHALAGFFRPVRAGFF